MHFLIFSAAKNWCMLRSSENLLTDNACLTRSHTRILGNSGIQDSYRDIRESRMPTRKFKNLGFLPGNSEIQDSYQESQEPRIPGRKFKIFQEVKRSLLSLYINTVFCFLDICTNFFECLFTIYCCAFSILYCKTLDTAEKMF